MQSAYTILMLSQKSLRVAFSFLQKQLVFVIFALHYSNSGVYNF